MDERRRHSSPTSAPRRAARRVVVPRRAACRRYPAITPVRRRTATTRGSATTTRGAPRSRRASAARGRDRGRDRAGRGTARRSRRGPARVALRRRGTPVAVAVTPPAEQRSSSRPGLCCRSRTLRRSDFAGRAGRADQRLIGGIDLVAMLGTGEHAGAHVARVIAEGRFDGSADFRIALYEPGRDLADEVAEHVVRNDELPVHVRPGADPVNKYADALAHERRRLGGDSL